MKVIIDKTNEGTRADVFLAGYDPEITRSRAQKLIEEGNAAVNGRTIKTSYRLCEGDVLEYTVPAAAETEITPEDIPLDIVYEDKDMLEATEAEMKSLGGDVITFTVDVLSKEQIFDAVNAVADKWGHIDILVNDAGICPWADFLEIPEEDWDKVMGINLKGYFLMSQAVGRIMSKQKDGGSIIHMSSVNGLAAEAQIAHYNVSKGGINMLTMSMALELAKYNIRVNAICPGFIDTRLNRSDIENEEWLKEYLKTIPMGRVGKP